MWIGRTKYVCVCVSVCMCVCVCVCVCLYVCVCLFVCMCVRFLFAFVCLILCVGVGGREEGVGVVGGGRDGDGSGLQVSFCSLGGNGTERRVFPHHHPTNHLT